MLQLLFHSARFPAVVLALVFCLSITVGTAGEVCCTVYHGTQEPQAIPHDIMQEEEVCAEDTGCCSAQNENGEEKQDAEKHAHRCATCTLCSLYNASILAPVAYPLTVEEIPIQLPRATHLLRCTSLRRTPPTPPPNRLVA